jgi:hypothetical protein
MTGPSATRIDEVGMPAMRFSQGPAHAVCSLWRQNQMDMIGHKAVRPRLHTKLAQLLREHVAINLLISILKENCFATISALGQVVRQTRDDHARKATHAGKIPRTRVNT